MIRTMDYTIMNDGSPTRFVIDSIKAEIRHSWIDTTVCRGCVADRYKWNCVQLDKGSDHYQILITIDAAIYRVENTEEEKQWKWKFPGDKDPDKLWQKFRNYIAERWDYYLQNNLLLRKEDSELTIEEQDVEELYDMIHQGLHAGGHAVFGTSLKEQVWKNWISKTAQRVSIQYHKFYRHFRNKRHKTAADWNRLKALRQHRNRVMNQYKREWLERKFQEKGIHHRDSWKIVAEVRDLNDTKGRSIPELIDPDTKKVVAISDKEKVEYINNYQHRFNTVPPKKPSYCWDPLDVYTVPEYKQGPEDVLDQQHKDHEPVIVMYKVELQPIDYVQNTQDELIPNIDRLQDHFKRWIFHRTRRKWQEAKKDHEFYSQMLNADITVEEIQRSIKSFNSNKACGPDKIDIKMVKKGGSAVVKMLCRLYNKMLQTGYVPQGMKERWIIPIMKPGKQANIPKNLRPTSLTSYLGKVYEKIMVYRLVTYLVRLQLLEPVHFAYLSGRSTTDCMVYMVDRIMRNMNKRLKTHAVYFDFSSAFDTVQLPMLLWKLEHEYFISGRFLESLSGFLTKRRSAVKINNTVSDWKQDIVGVPQGGALSPILFLIYVDRLGLVNNIKGLNFGIFADDLAIFTSVQDKKIAQRILQDGVLFVQWYTLQHGLFLNHTKTQYKMFQKQRKVQNTDKLDLYLSGYLNTIFNQVPRKPDLQLKYEEGPVKYLGIWLDTRLTFKDHVEKMIKKVMGIYYIINRNLRKLWHIKADVVWTIVNTCVFSIFDYSAVLYDLMKKGIQKELQTVYNRIIRGLFHCTKGTRLLDIMFQVNSYTLEHRMRYQTAQHFSQLLPTPRSGILHHVLSTFW